MKETSASLNVTIRRAGRDDAPVLIALIVALAEFEKLPPPDADAQARLVEHGFGDAPKYEAYLAEVEGVPDPIGYAFVFETYSTFLARPTLYLEDLFVLPDHRGQGVGSQLLRHCVGLAQARGCGRMEWTCLDWNTRAQSVYEKMGARRMSEWHLYRMTGDTMEMFLEENR